MSKQNLPKKVLGHPIVRNFISVSLIQGLGMVLPLITIPYLISVLGADGFGTISFALAYTTFFVVFTDYGYNLLGTREVALHRDDSKKVNTIFSTMISAQFLLTLAAVVLFALSLIFIPAFREHWEVFACTFGIVLGSTLLPTWFFQGMEHFNILNWIQFGYRALYTILIFVFIKDPTDLILVPILNSGTHLFGGALGLLLIMTRYQLKYVRPSLSSIQQSLRNGWNLFVSAISTTSLQQMPILILGFLTNETVVGLFSFAEKIILVFRLAIQILSTVLYPRVVLKAKESYSAVAGLISKVGSLGLVALIPLGLLIYYTPTLLVSLKEELGSEVTANSLKIMSIIPALIFLKICAQQMILAFDLTAAYARVMITAGLLNLLLLLSLVYLYEYRGAAWAMVFTELFIILYLRSHWRHAKKLNRIT